MLHVIHLFYSSLCIIMHRPLMDFIDQLLIYERSLEQQGSQDVNQANLAKFARLSSNTSSSN